MKKILPFFLILLVSGCSLKYDLTITDKKEVKEKFYLGVVNEEVTSYNYSIDEYLDHYKYIYSTSDNFKDYNIKTKKSNPQSYFIVNRNYKSIDDYIKSNSFLSMFDSATIESTDKYYEFKSGKNIYLSNLNNDSLLSETDKYDSVSISIKFYNEVVNSNADEVDKKNNIYTWYIDDNTTKDFIYFKTSKKVKYLVKIKDIIMDNILSITIISSIVIILLISIGYIVFKSKKNNEI